MKSSKILKWYFPMILMFAACSQEPARFFENDRTIKVDRLPDVQIDVDGPRQLLDSEMARVMPTVRPLLTADQAAAATLEPVKESGMPSESDLVDLSGFAIEARLTPDDQGARAEADGIGQVTRALSGPVGSALYVYTGYVSQGYSVTYTVWGAISVGILMPTNDDADIYVQNCDGSIVGWSTFGGTATDYADLYTPSGVATCRQLRVYGYRSTGYKIAIYNYQ